MDEDMEYDSGAGAAPQQQQYQTPVHSTMPEDGRRLLLVHAHYSEDIVIIPSLLQGPGLYSRLHRKPRQLHIIRDQEY